MENPMIHNHNIVTNLLKREAERKVDLQKKRNEKNLINPEHENYNYFMNLFQDKMKHIEILLDDGPKANSKEIGYHLDIISKEIGLLQKFVGESVLFLRGYDMRVCQEALQEIEAKARKLEDRLLPKKKFGFRNKKAPKKIEEESKNGHDEVDSVRRACKFNEELFGFKDEVNKTLTIDNEALLKKDVTLQNLEKCVVRLLGAPSTLIMSGLRDCLVICGPVTTSIFADKCTSCKIVLACQQLRLHNSTDCDVYLHVTSKAIIEDCNKIRVAPYNYMYPTLAEDFYKAGLDRTVNHWDQIDDFNWLVLDKQSPNWSILDESVRIRNWDEYAMTAC